MIVDTTTASLTLTDQDVADARRLIGEAKLELDAQQMLYEATVAVGITTVCQGGMTVSTADFVPNEVIRAARRLRARRENGRVAARRKEIEAKS